MKSARNAILITVVCLFLLGPGMLYAAQEGLGLSLPDWLTAEDSSYLSGGTESSKLEEHLSLEGFSSEKLQDDLNVEVENHIPLKADVLLGNAAIQRSAIAVSNALFGFKAYPTFYGSGTVYIPSVDALADMPLGNRDEFLDEVSRAAEGIVSVAAHYPDKQFCLILSDQSNFTDANPAADLVSERVSTKDCADAIEAAVEQAENVQVVNIRYDDTAEYYQNHYRADHHWNGYGTLEAYRVVEEVMGLTAGRDNESSNVDFRGWLANGSYARDGLMLVNEAVTEPKFDLSGLTVKNETLPSIIEPNGVDSLWSKGRKAEFSFYSEWYGTAKLTGKSPIKNSECDEKTRAAVVMDSFGNSMHWLIAQNYRYTKCFLDVRIDSEGDETLQQRIEDSDADVIYFVCNASAYARLPQTHPHYFEVS